MVCFLGNPIYKWMIWGYSYFKNPPHGLKSHHMFFFWVDSIWQRDPRMSGGLNNPMLWCFNSEDDDLQSIRSERLSTGCLSVVGLQARYHKCLHYHHRRCSMFKSRSVLVELPAAWIAFHSMLASNMANNHHNFNIPQLFDGSVQFQITDKITSLVWKSTQTHCWLFTFSWFRKSIKNIWFPLVFLENPWINLVGS